MPASDVHRQEAIARDVLAYKFSIKIPRVCFISELSLFWAFTWMDTKKKKWDFCFCWHDKNQPGTGLTLTAHIGQLIERYHGNVVSVTLCATQNIFIHYFMEAIGKWILNIWHVIAKASGAKNKTKKDEEEEAKTLLGNDCLSHCNRCYLPSL